MGDAFNYEDILLAKERLKGKVCVTPLKYSTYLSGSDKNYYFKLENLQEVGSFKLRGAFNKLMSLTPEEAENGVVAVSSGNHGIAVSYAAKQLGIKKTKIFVAEDTPDVKVNKIRSYGAEVMQVGKNNNETEAIARDFIANSDMNFADPCSRDPLVYAGQGTIGIELLEQNPDLDTIIVPIGGGCLLTGISVAAKKIKPSIRVIGVESDTCPSMIAAMRDNTFYEEYPIKDSLCNALVGGIGKIAFDMSKDYIDDIIAVDEANIAKAVGLLYKEEQIAAEPSSAICVGAALQEPERIPGKNMAFVISGGNVQAELLQRLVAEYEQRK